MKKEEHPETAMFLDIVPAEGFNKIDEVWDYYAGYPLAIGNMGQTADMRRRVHSDAKVEDAQPGEYLRNRMRGPQIAAPTNMINK